MVEQLAEDRRAAEEWRRNDRMGLWGWILWLVCGFWILSLVFTLVDFMRKFEPGPKSFEQWHAAHARAGDELWEYDSGPESWEHLCGECGYALVREGTVFEVWLVAVN